MQPVPQTLPPEAQVVQMALAGMTSRAISEIARMEIPDILKARGPLSASELAPDLKANPEALHRLMRAGASIGIFTESADGKFGMTPMSETMTSDSPVSVKAVVREMGGWWLTFFDALGDGVRSGKSQAKQICGLDSWWDFLNSNPDQLASFAESMKSNSLASLKGVLEHCDFAGIKKVVDIGGSYGHLVIALLEKYPELQGVSFDIPDVTEVARAQLAADPGVAARLEFVAGNMFAETPPADAYVLKHIIHDWDDERCNTLLATCHRNLEPGGRLICVDCVVPPLGDAGGSTAKFMSLLMMLSIDGKERTRKEWEDLYTANGFRITKVTPLQDNLGTSIVEGVRV